MSKSRLFLVILFVLLFIVGLSSVIQVNQGEGALLFRFGAPVKPMLDPGLHVVLPFGMDKVVKVRVDAVQSVSLGDILEEDTEGNQAGRLVTGDQNLILAGLALRIQPDGQNLWQYHLQATVRDQLLRSEVEAMMATWAAARGVDQLLLDGRSSLGRELASRLREGPIEKECGIRILEITGTRINPPKEVQSSFDLVSRSEANRQTLVTKAQQDSQTNLLLAQSEAYRQNATAKADGFAIREGAKRDVERFRLRLGALLENPDRPSHFRLIWEEETSRMLTKLKDQGRIGILDGSLVGDAPELYLAPLSPSRPLP